MDQPNGPVYKPSDVQRVTQIFAKPSFFIDGADSNDIVQGAIGDCWFCSALSTMSTAEGLVEKFCVAVSRLPLSRHIHVDMNIFSETSKWGSMDSSSSAIHSGWSSSSMSASRFIYLSRHVNPIELAYCIRQSPSSKSSGMRRKSCIIMISKSTTSRLGKEGRAFISRGQGRTVRLGYLLSKRRTPSFMEAIGR